MRAMVMICLRSVERPAGRPSLRKSLLLSHRRSLATGKWDRHGIARKETASDIERIERTFALGSPGQPGRRTNRPIVSDQPKASFASSASRR